MSDHCFQIAGSSEELSSVVEEIHKNIVVIRELAKINSEAPDKTASVGRDA